MIRKMILFFAMLHSGIVVARTAQADDWGSICGQIIVEGEIPERRLLIAKDADVKDKAICAAEDHFAEDLIIDKDSRGLANVFVYLYKIPKGIDPNSVKPSEVPVTVTHKGCQFVPHCQILRTGQVLKFSSDDQVPHNPHHYALKNTAIGALVTQDYTMELIFRKPEAFPFMVSCDFHPWMKGYWLVVDHPYAALTDKNGKFQIDQLPIGEHTFKIWHERPAYLEKSFKVMVTAGDAVELPTMKLDLTRLERPTKSK